MKSIHIVWAKLENVISLTEDILKVQLSRWKIITQFWAFTTSISPLSPSTCGDMKGDELQLEDVLGTRAELRKSQHLPHSWPLTISYPQMIKQKEKKICLKKGKREATNIGEEA